MEKEMVGSRIDLLVLGELKKAGGSLSLTRSQIAEYIPKFVVVNGKSVKKGYSIREQDNVQIDISGLISEISKKLESLADKIEPFAEDLNIIEESNDWIVINKPHGVAVHPGIGNENNTIANMVKYYLSNKNEFDPTVARAGIVHRLDKGVGGLMIIAKNRNAQLYLQKQFEERRVTKLYLGQIKKLKSEVPESKNDLQEEIKKFTDSGFEVDNRWTKVEGYIARQANNRMMMQINDYYKGKNCVSYVLPIDGSRLLIKLETGRMHQARASVRYLGWVIVGDKLYGDEQGEGKIALEQVLLSLVVSEGINKTWKLV
ncbi:RluA family pseudouridine synthase [Candidatus Dojkabacteria bacterium]|nr:RluA family pseudouridine synthase [Candidatus Dojkabacteria bacterium]